MSAIDSKGRTYGQRRLLESSAPRGNGLGQVTEDFLVRSIAPWGYTVLGRFATLDEATTQVQAVWRQGRYVTVDHQMTETVSRINGTNLARAEAIAADSTVSVPAMSARRKAAPAPAGRELG